MVSKTYFEKKYCLGNCNLFLQKKRTYLKHIINLKKNSTICEKIAKKCKL